MCSQNASFRQKHANKWCLGLKPPTYSQIPPLLRDLPAQMLKTFIWPNILLGELQHAEEATVYHVGCSCLLLRDVALPPLPLSFVYKIKTKLKTIHWFYDCIQLLQAPSWKGSEKSLIKTSRIASLKTADQQMYSPKWHVLMTSILQIQDLSELCVLAY